MYTKQVKDISVDELKDMKKTGKGLLVLDAREIEAYCKGHIPGACNIFDAEIASLAPDKVDKSLQIVVYGPGQAKRSQDPMDRLAGDTIDRLKKAGFGNAVELRGGFEAWANAGHRIDSCSPKSVKPADVPLMSGT